MIIGLDEISKCVIQVCMLESTEMDIVKIGHKITPGVYTKPLSRYHKVLNYREGNTVVSLCAKSISPGPHRIILNLDDLDEIESFSLSETELIFDGKVSLVHLDHHLYKQPQTLPAITGYSKKRLIIEQLNLLLGLEGGSLLMLINGEFPALSPLDKELKKCLLKGLASLWCGDQKNFVKNVKGRGPGSTPSGDDFLLGYLIALSWLIEAWGEDLHSQRELVYQTALRENPITNTFLAQAYNYELDKTWADYLNSLAVNKINRIEGDFQKLAELGHTSGEDMLSGFWVGFLWNWSDVFGAYILEEFGIKKDL